MKKILLCLLSIMLLTLNFTTAFASNERASVVGTATVAGVANYEGVPIPVALNATVTADYSTDYYDIITVNAIYGGGSVKKTSPISYVYSIYIEKSELINNGSVVASKSSGFQNYPSVGDTNSYFNTQVWYPNKSANRTKCTATTRIAAYDGTIGSWLRVTPKVTF